MALLVKNQIPRPLAAGSFIGFNSIKAFTNTITVVAGNRSYVWWGLRTLNVKDRITGYGRLLNSLSES